MRRVYWTLSLFAGLAACSSQDNNTKIVVAVWSDLAVPTEMDSVRIDVQGPTAASQPTTFPLATSDDLPAILALVPPNNQASPFSVTASGFKGDGVTPVVSQKATTAFIAGESLVLKLFLGRACPGGVCAELTVDPNTLTPYDPKAPLLSPDAGAGLNIDGGAADGGEAETNGVADGGKTGDSAIDVSADVPVSPFDGGVGDDGGGIATGGTGGSGGDTGTAGTGGVGGNTAATGGVGGVGTGGGSGSGGIVTGGTGGSSVADAAVDTLVTPDAAPDVAICGAAGQACCAGNTCVGGGCCVASMCVAIGATCSTGGTCSNGSCAACSPASTVPQACSTGFPGVCAAGTQKCTAAGVWGTCMQTTPKGTRDCSSKADNDCDGVADYLSSTCACPAGTSQSCSTGLLGICAAGTQQCVLSSDKSSTAWGDCVQTNQKGTESCANMGTDDDCDGIIDNCNVNGLAVGACLNGGTWSCAAVGPSYCKPSNAAIGTTTPQTVAAPNGSFDWNCDGASTVSDPTVLQTTACASRTAFDCTTDAYYELPLRTLRVCGKTYSATKYVCAVGSPCAMASGIGVIVSGTFACN